MATAPHNPTSHSNGFVLRGAVVRSNGKAPQGQTTQGNGTAALCGAMHSNGEARPGWALLSKARIPANSIQAGASPARWFSAARPGKVRHGTARQCTARLGTARRCKAMQGFFSYNTILFVTLEV